ncbi:MAG TPA: hypothetical protein VHF22_14955, partial [Planctomycetota bacterium]|nr:hypothetical protein [Planctomycetota bacterium]
MRSSTILAAALAVAAAAPVFAEGQPQPPLPPLRYPRDRPVAMERLELSLDVDLVGKSVSGTATLVARPVAPVVRQLELDAVDLDVHAVFDFDGKPLRFVNTGEKLDIQLDPPVRNEPGSRI